MKVKTADTLCGWHLVKLLIESDITGHSDPAAAEVKNLIEVERKMLIDHLQCVMINPFHHESTC